ncbi:hypothetical protein LZC95_49390 [Pendulispora brunnea]|uniref:PH domain-containing protein n=1 Tax=Pendulispora brunnea TaxID=2905690 RepID=A0ABZ2KA49_9BACT
MTKRRYEWISEVRIMGAFLRAIAFRAIADAPGGARHATTRHTSQYKPILFVLILLMAIEIPVMHLLLAHVLGSGGWKTVLQRVIAGLSAYGVIWLIGDARLMRESAHVLRPEGLELRLGLRWNGLVPYDAIDRVARAPGVLSPRPGAVDITPVGMDTPNVVVYLRTRIELYGIFNIPRTADEVRLFVDEPNALIAALREVMHAD